MPFPTDTTRRSLAAALSRAQSQAGSIKRIAQNNSAAMAAGSVTSGAIVSLLDNLKGAKTVLSEAAGLTGMDAYAQEQLGQTIAAEFTAMMDAIDAAGAWIITNLPKDGSGYLLVETMSAQGVRTERLFTTAQTAGLRTLLDALVATID